MAQMQYAARRGFYLVLPATKSSSGCDVPPELPSGWLSTDTRLGACLLLPNDLIGQPKALDCPSLKLRSQDAL